MLKINLEVCNGLEKFDPIYLPQSPSKDDIITIKKGTSVIVIFRTFYANTNEVTLSVEVIR